MAFFRRSLITLAAGAAAPACAQELLPQTDNLVTFSRSISVQQRPQKGYEARGVSVGAIKIQPQLTFEPRFTDNVYSTTSNRKSETYFRLSPQLQASLQTDQTVVTLQAAGDIERHPTFSSENQENVSTSGFAVRSIGRSTKLSAGFQYENGSIDRESQQAFALTVRPFRFRTKSYAVGLSQRFSRVLVSAQAGITSFDYGNGQLADGTIVDQSFNDRERRRIQARAEVKQSESLAYFLQTTYDDTSYTRPTDTFLDRSSNRIKILAGTRFELPILARGEVAIGYTKSQSKGSIFRNFSGLAISSNATFFPSQLTNVTVDLRREVRDAGIRQSSGYVAFVSSVRIDHELLRSLILSGQVQYEKDSFNNIDRDDRRLTYLLSGGYRMNRNVTLRLTFERIDFISRGIDRNISNIKPTFARDRVNLQILLRI